MVDEGNQHENIQKGSSCMDSSSETRSRAGSIIDALAIDYPTSISSVVPSMINDTDSSDDRGIPRFSIRQIYKHLAILSLSFVLIFTAYSGISFLQSSLNTKRNVGINSLIVSSAFQLVSELNII